MQFGVTFFPMVGPADKPAHQYYDESLELARLAEQLGFQHVKTVEHYFFAYGGYSPDPVTFLTAVAARTSQVRLSTAGVIPAFTHPVKLAGKLAMLDNLSHGRLEVGVARAFLPDEFAAFEVPMAESRARFTEGVEAMRLLWTVENATWQGSFHRFGPVTLLPRPFQRPHPPIFVSTARSLESAEAAGRNGFHLQVVPAILTPDDFRELLSAYRTGWAAGGHRPGGGQVHASYICHLAEDGHEARRIAQHDDQLSSARSTDAVASWGSRRSDQYPGYEKLADPGNRASFDEKLAQTKVLAGTADQVREQIERLVEWYGEGLTLSLGIHSGHLPAAAAERTMRLFAEQVVPKLATAG